MTGSGVSPTIIGRGAIHSTVPRKTRLIYWQNVSAPRHAYTKETLADTVQPIIIVLFWNRAEWMSQRTFCGIGFLPGPINRRARRPSRRRWNKPALGRGLRETIEPYHPKPRCAGPPPAAERRHGFDLAAPGGGGCAIRLNGASAARRDWPGI